MKRPLTRALLQVVASGFYQEHTGLLLSLFLGVFVNFFYTRVPNQSHLTEEQIIQNGFRLAITSVSEPLGVLVLGGVGVFYSLKSWQYVAGRLQKVDAQFLFYSSNALSRAQQLRSWATVQVVILLPIIVLYVYAMVVGFIFGHWLIPLLLPGYLLALTLAGAWYYTHLLNEAVTEPVSAAGAGWVMRWPKPFFTLPLYEISRKKRIVYAITKVASVGSILAIFVLFPDSHADIRLLAIMGLCVALAHVVLLFQASDFELFYLRFARNFPHSHWQRCWHQVALYSLLLLPDLLWLLLAGKLSTGLLACGWLLSVTLLFRALLYWLGQRMYLYLRVVFGLFVFFLLATLFGFTALLTIGNLLTAWLLLYRSKYE